MKGIAPSEIRNFVLAGHAGCGKTTLADLMLHKSGVVNRLGSVDQGTSVSDYRNEEKERKCSMYSAPLNCPWKDCHFFFVDTPGYADFFGETRAATSVADTVLIVVDAATGIDMGTIRAWKAARDAAIPRAFFITGLDREQADYQGTLQAIQDTYGATTCIPFTVPIGEKADLSGVVNVLRATDVPDAVSSMVADYREALMDTIAESSEDLMTKYLEGEELTDEEIAQGLHEAINSADIVPVFAGSAGKDVGVDALMDGIVNLFPNPVNGRSVDLKDGELVLSDETSESLGFVFKSVTDPFIGQLTFFRVFSGTFKADTDTNNITEGSKERLGSLLLVNGKQQEQVDQAGPGEIVAVAKLKVTKLNDTLSMGGTDKQVAPIEFPKPTMSYAVYPVTKGDDEKINSGLARLSEEDPTITFERNPETRESVLSGLGEQHLQNVISRLQETAKVGVDLRTPKVPYRETITATGQAQYRHKKQTGGHGQFAEVHLRVEPLPDEEFSFDNEVVGGNIPKNFIPAVEKGVLESLPSGPLANCKVINIRAVVYDGKHHPVDSSEMAFKIAARSAFRDAIKNAKPQLLEPIMKLKIMFPEEYMGDISGDLNARRGRILGMDREEGLQVVNADVPMAEVFSYATQLRSITQGRGSFEMEFDRYESVPSNLVQQIQAEAAKAAEEE
ncbi:MAG: elongation factor G [Candidatus Pacebacteria bacterium]|nr:elongation factor G [Candidatus Paceibacterota bacterium]